MTLKPQDVLILLKLLAIGGERAWTYNALSEELSMSPSETHAGAKRAQRAGLAIERFGGLQPNISAFEKFLLHGLRYVFVPDRGELSRGIPTAYAGPPLNEKMIAPDEPPPIWPCSEGRIRGMAFSPLYKAAPQAALRDERLYELLVLVDAIRGGRSREREIGETELISRLRAYE